MRPFNCLSADCPILGPHLLEASAGTGKTFSIEHVVVRLLLESEEIELEQILAVTFTRAATRDLKRRIRSNLQEALSRIRSFQEGWEYLHRFLGSKRAMRKLEDALLAFDRCQIFTIHGFCHRMLQEFAFEAELGFAIRNPDEEMAIPARLYREAKRFIESGIGPDLLCPEQMAQLFKEYDTFDALVDALLEEKSERPAPSFAELVRRYQDLWASQEKVEEAALLEAFQRIRPDFKAEVKGNFEKQLKALAKSADDPLESFRHLLREKGSLFAFIDPSNRKAKAKEEVFPFLVWASNAIRPLVLEAMNQKHILGCLQKRWNEIAQSILSETGWMKPDEILRRMQKALAKQAFVASVRNKYKAVIVDEFQDTDPLQWEIFKRIFLDEEHPLHAFYLVGDPKQSIYRFRKADIYTYFEARNFLGPSASFCLDTNYRSSPNMIVALNALFERNWLPLPKWGTTMPCSPVKAGSTISSDLSDEKGAIHFLYARSFEEDMLPYAAQEIERLLPLLKSPSSFAILVKDRYQAEAALRFLRSRSIPAIARSHIPLGKTLAFQAVYELFEALFSLESGSLRRIVTAGPFAFLDLRFSRNLLEEEGLIAFCETLLECPVADGEFQRDLKQVVEQLLIWESRSGFSFQGLFRFLEEFEGLDSDEGGRRYLETDTEAVQILTLHVSKGLEFEIVFAFGLSARPPEEEDAQEADAEKLRQLYVAMTRAKKRLYAPLPLKDGARGSLSPMELFCRTLELQEGALPDFFKKIGSISCETIESVSLSSPLVFSNEEKIETPSQAPPFISPSFLHSFTSLAKPKEKEVLVEQPTRSDVTAHTLPRGVETGILIHAIFERLFSSPQPIWRDRTSVAALVSQELKGTPLIPWEKPIEEMIWKTLHLNIPCEDPFSLIEADPKNVQVEMEFLFSEPPHFVKGFIDLVLVHRNKVFFFDWKTNWLGPDDSFYVSLEEAMTAHDYWLQGKLYAEALRRHVKRFYNEPFESLFGGAVYLFLRGGGVCFFKPNL